MSNDADHTPPEIGADDDNSKGEDLLFVSAMSPTTVDVSLSGAEEDDDDENPFGQAPPPRAKTATTTTNIIDAPAVSEPSPPKADKPMLSFDEDDDVFGVKSPASLPPPVTPTPAAVPKSPEPAPSTSVKQETPLFSANTSVNAPSTPIRSMPSYDSQISSSTPVSKSVLTGPVTTAPKRAESHDIEITVSDPTKVGDGMSSYMTYRITTKTTLSMFKKSEFTVNRRFSDFLGLHSKLVHKHLNAGIIVPSPPEKDTLSMAKVKVSKDEAIPTDFIDRRRALLERYLNRLVQHAKLLTDADVQTFLEQASDLPKSSNTQALSGAGVLRALSNISNQVTKLTAKTSEQDQWFEEKHGFILDLHAHLKHLYNQFNSLFAHRKEASQALKQFSAALNHLATSEEHTLLSSALIELANLEEKLEQANNDEMLKEYSTLTELIKEYVGLLDMVQLAFQERIKTHQYWLHAEDTLKKKRESKTKLELNPKSVDKLPQAEMEISEWEGKVIRGKEDFERVSATIKQEMEAFEDTRLADFKKAFDQYLQNELEQKEKVLQIWEAYLPEANKISA